MKDFVLIFRVLYRNRYAVEKESNTGKRKLTRSTVMMLSLLPMVAVICVMLGFVAAELTTRYSAMTLINAILSAAQLFILFMSLPAMMSTLYAAEDAAFLSALPVRPTAVFFAKLLLVYVGALKIAAILLFPSLLTVSVTYAAAGNSMSYAFFPLILLIILAAPMLPIFIVVLFSMPVMWIGSRLKGRATVKTVFSLLFYIILMAGYMVLVFFINTQGMGQSGNIVSDAALDGLRLLSDVMYPNTVLVSMCLGIDPAVNFGIFLAIWTGLTAATVLFAMLFYRRISTRRAESRAEEKKGAPSYKRHRLVISLVKKDLITVMRDPSAAMGTFSNIVLAPIVMVVMFFFIRGDGDMAMSEFSAEMMMRGIVMLYPVIFLAGTNMVAMTAYSREGESFFVAKALPIPARTSVNAKLLFSLLSAGAALAVIFVISAALYRIDIASSLAMVAASLLFCAGSGALHIYFDIKKGNVHWKSQSDMRAGAAGGISALIPMLLSILPAIGFVVAGVFLAGLEDSLGRAGTVALYWGLILVVAGAVAAAGLYILYEKGVPLYDKIGENRAAAKERLPRIGKNGFLGG